MLTNWYGIDSIGFEFRGVWNDPLIHYKGHEFYEPDIHDGLWEHYTEDGGDPNNDDTWKQYVIDNVVDYLEDIIFTMGE